MPVPAVYRVVKEAATIYSEERFMTKYRSKFQKEHDRARIAHMIGEGHKQTEIAVELGISPQLVCKEIKAIKEAWRNTMLSDITDHKARELERLNYMERQLWESWEISRKEGRRKNQQWAMPGTPTDDDPNPKPVPLRASMTTETEHGDPRIMSAILDIVKERCKLLDLYKPIKINRSLPGEDPSKMTVQERAEGVLKILNKYSTKPLGARPAVTPPAGSDATAD